MKSRSRKRVWNWSEPIGPGAEAGSTAAGDGGGPLECVRRAAARLAQDDIDSPRLCAERLLAHALRVERIDLYRMGNAPLPAEAAARFELCLERRLRREPLQHIVGYTEFWSLRIRCDRRALIPRPETEYCVAAALDVIGKRPRPRIADLGTGAGCIAIALARALPRARVFATDISPEALSLARENVAEHGLGERISLLEGDLTAPLRAAGVAGTLDVVVCNPPYVAESEMDTLQPEVVAHDPHIALAGGPDGLHFHRRILRESGDVLRGDGGLVLEMGDGQAGAIRALVRDNGWTVAAFVKDAAGTPRVCVARRLDDG